MMRPTTRIVAVIAIVAITLGWAGTLLAQTTYIPVAASDLSKTASQPAQSSQPSQPSQPPPPPPSSPASMQSLPSNWIGFGGSYDPSPSVSPKSAGWWSYGRLLSSSQALYSFTTWDTSGVEIRGTKPNTVVQAIQQSMRTGIALVVRQFGKLSILGIGDGGLATVGAATTGAFSGGGMAFYIIAHGWTFEVGYRVLKTTSGLEGRIGLGIIYMSTVDMGAVLSYN